MGCHKAERPLRQSLRAAGHGRIKLEAQVGKITFDAGDHSIGRSSLRSLTRKTLGKVSQSKQTDLTSLARIETFVSTLFLAAFGTSDGRSVPSAANLSSFNEPLVTSIGDLDESST
jgi:hypothetical protein